MQRHGRAAAARTAARCSAARPRRCPASTPTASTTSPASSSASCRRASGDRRPRDRRRRRADRAAVVRPAHQRLFAGAADRVRARWGSHVDSTSPSSARRSARRCCGRTGRICSRSRRSSTPARSRAWRTSPAAASRRTCRATLPEGRGFTLDRASWTVPPLFQLAAARRRRRRRRDVPRVQHGRRPDPRLRHVRRERRFARSPRSAGERPWLLGHVT